MANSTALIFSDDALPNSAKVQICSDTSEGLKELIRRKDSKETPTLNQGKAKKIERGTLNPLPESHRVPLDVK